MHMCHHRLPHCSNDRHSGIGWPKAGAKNNPSYVGHGRIVEKKIFIQQLIYTFIARRLNEKLPFSFFFLVLKGGL